jgi:glucose/arabinose dehydrogenase
MFIGAAIDWRRAILVPGTLGAIIVGTAVTHAGSPPGDLVLQLVDDGYTQPVGVTGAGDGSGRLFIIEQPGRISIVGGGDFLDITAHVDSTSNEQGLLGLAFHPNFASNGYFFVNYTHDPGSGPDVTRVSRFEVSEFDDDVADPNSEFVVLSFPQDSSNHNGGDIRFGPDGYLYIGTGDGGGSEDPNDRGQSLDTLLGKILRIDVDSVGPYDIPPGNPFVQTASALDEIWAYGLRNPWSASIAPPAIFLSGTLANTQLRRSTTRPPRVVEARITDGAAWKETRRPTTTPATAARSPTRSWFTITISAAR